MKCRGIGYLIKPAVLSVLVAQCAIAEPSLSPEATLNNAGVQKMNKGRLKDAIDDFSAGIKIQPDYYYLYSNRILARYQTRDYEGAIADYSEIAKRPLLSSAHRRSKLVSPALIAECHAKLGLAESEKCNYVTAVKEFDEALSLAPAVSEYYHFRGLAKENLGDKAGANKDFEKAKTVHAERVR